jgi:hypothetical protein
MTRRERWSIPVLAALTMLLARGDWSACAARKENPLVVTLGPKVVVAQSEEEKHPWGGWQFPSITRLDSGRLRVSFSQTLDSASLNTVRKHYPPGRYDSDEGGRTWQPARAGGSDGGCRLANGTAIRLQSPPAQDIPRVQLPSPAGQPDHGYHGVYLMRDPRQMPPGPGQWHVWRRSPGRETWERLPATLDDPDGGVLCYDPPGNDHAVVRWQMLMQLVALPDNSALAVFYNFRLNPDRTVRPKWKSYCLRTTDEGRTWRFHGIVACDDHHPLAGFSEPYVTLRRDGVLLAALRTECAKSGPLYAAQSRGRTWSEPAPMHPFGVLPRILSLENGVTVLSFGRPGVHLLFTRDGTKWEGLNTVIAEEKKQTRTSGYMGLIAVGTDRFLITDDQFDCPNEEGQPRKTILVREVQVSATPQR